MSNTSLLNVRVARRTEEAQDILSFELVAEDGAPLPAFGAGAHIDVHLPGGITRQYSLCNDPRETHRYQIAVLRDPASRGGSIAMHDSVQVGQPLKISPPRNHFPLAHDAQRSLLMAGGIGVTPILCMAERLANIGADFDMHYCTRSSDRTAFRTRIRSSGYTGKVHHHFDDGPPEQKLDLETVLAQEGGQTHLYVCGPKGFMDVVLDTARELDWPESRLHYEFFGAELIQSDSDAGFDVVLASSGRTVNVPADKTVVQALAAAGIEVMTACEQGVCGTCMTRVLEGTPDHRDSYLTPEERTANDQFLPCCSRSKGARLVLDL